MPNVAILPIEAIAVSSTGLNHNSYSAIPAADPGPEYSTLGVGTPSSETYGEIRSLSISSILIGAAVISSTITLAQQAVFTSSLRIGSVNNLLGNNTPEVLLANNVNKGLRLVVFNESSDTGAFSQISTQAGLATLSVYTFGANYTSAASRYLANGNALEATGVGGLSINASNAAGVIRFYTNANNERMSIDSSGNVGIGTSSPAALLDVVGTSTGIVAARVQNLSTGTGATTRAMLYNDSGTWGGMSMYSSTHPTNPNGVYILNTSPSGIIGFSLNSTERMRITSSGNVGIGTSSPSQRLTVASTGTYSVAAWNETAVAAGVGTAMLLAGGTAGNGLAAIGGYFSGAATTDGGYLTLSTRAVTSGTITERMRIDSSGNVGIGTSNSSGYKLFVNGSFAATTKSFVINHPTRPGLQLRHGSLEGPENGVYVRGRLKDNFIIELPEYWTGLVDAESITVDLTPLGSYQRLFVKDILNNRVIVAAADSLGAGIDCFYTVWAERKDVDKLEVEFQA